MYAIVRTGGKQYRVEEGRSVVVERLPVEEGETVELKDVLLIAQNGDVTVGSPLIDGARVLAEVEANSRHEKIIVFKYKAKVRTRKKTGHRQSYTRLAVREILLPGQEPKKDEKPKRKRAKAAEDEKPADAEAQAETPVAEPEAAAPVAEPATEEKPKRTRRAPAKADAGEEKPKATRARRKPPAPKAETTEEKPKRRTRRKADDDKTE